MGSCPRTCLHHPDQEGSCYYLQGYMAWHLDRLDRRRIRKGPSDAEMLRVFVATLPEGRRLRHRVFGDLAREGGSLDTEYLEAEREAVPVGGLAFSYAHHPDYAARCRPSRPGETVINVSADTDRQAVKAVRRGHPTVVVLPGDPKQAPRKLSDGTPIAICPHQLRKGVNCSNCGGRPDTPLCAMAGRDFVVGFLAHGTRRAGLEERLDPALRVIPLPMAGGR